MRLPYNPHIGNSGKIDFDRLKNELTSVLDNLPASPNNTFQNRMKALSALEGDRAIYLRAISHFNKVNNIDNVNPVPDDVRDSVFKQRVAQGLQAIDDNFWKSNPDLDPNFNYSQAFLASRMPSTDTMKSFYTPEESTSPYRHVVSLLGNSGPVWKDVSQEAFKDIQSDSQPIKDTERYLSGVNSNSPQQQYDDLVDNYNAGKFNGIY